MDINSAGHAFEPSEQVAALRGSLRSSSDFREWRFGVFHYLFGAVAIVLVAFLVDASPQHPWGAVLCGLAFALLCNMRVLLNRLRYWLLIGRPNRSIRRQIEAVLAEIDGRTPGKPTPRTSNQRYPLLSGPSHKG